MIDEIREIENEIDEIEHRLNNDRNSIIYTNINLRFS